MSPLEHPSTLPLPPLTDLAEALRASFETSAVLLRTIEHGLAERRTAWIAARPSTLAAPAEALDAAARGLADEEKKRNALLADVRVRLAAAALRGESPPAAELHVNVTRLCAALPRAQATRLRAAADAATALAKAVRKELALGERLLAFGARAQEGIVRAIARAAAGPQAAGYDRNARSRHGTGLGGPAGAPGSLLDGRL